MPRETIVGGGEPPEEERRRDDALRPRWLREVIGQKAVVERLRILINGSKKLKEPLSHILFDGPPGLGKTTFATVLPTELGTTIQSGLLSGPMRDRFKMHEHLEFYSVEELAHIIRVNARKLQTVLADDAALELARRSRGTPRIANARLSWARSYAASEGDGVITLEVARAALKMREVDG